MEIHTGIRKIFLIIISFSVITIFHENPVHAEDILILQGGNVGPFKETIEGLRSAITFSMKIIDVVDVNQRIPLCDYRVVIALGSRSAAAMKKNYCKGSGYIYALVLSPAEIKVDDFDNFIGVHPSPSFEGAVSAIKEKNKNTKKIGVVYTKSSQKFLEPLREAAAKQGIGVFSERIESVGEIEAAVDTILSGVDSFFILPDPVILDENVTLYLLKLLKKKNIFIVAPYRALLNYGADMAYAFDFVQMGKDLGALISKIASGKLEGPQLIFIRGSVFTK
jgi:ABC-type uncharacterized transport system substrate-binding protein